MLKNFFIFTFLFFSLSPVLQAAECEEVLSPDLTLYWNEETFSPVMVKDSRGNLSVVFEHSSDGLTEQDLSEIETLLLEQYSFLKNLQGDYAEPVSLSSFKKQTGLLAVVYVERKNGEWSYSVPGLKLITNPELKKQLEADAKISFEVLKNSYESVFLNKFGKHFFDLKTTTHVTIKYQSAEEMDKFLQDYLARKSK